MSGLHSDFRVAKRESIADVSAARKAYARVVAGYSPADLALLERARFDNRSHRVPFADDKNGGLKARVALALSIARARWCASAAEAKRAGSLPPAIPRALVRAAEALDVDDVGLEFLTSGWYLLHDAKALDAVDSLGAMRHFKRSLTLTSLGTHDADVVDAWVRWISFRCNTEDMNRLQLRLASRVAAAAIKLTNVSQLDTGVKRWAWAWMSADEGVLALFYATVALNDVPPDISDECRTEAYERAIELIEMVMQRMDARLKTEPR